MGICVLNWLETLIHILKNRKKLTCVLVHNTVVNSLPGVRANQEVKLQIGIPARS